MMSTSLLLAVALGVFAPEPADAQELQMLIASARGLYADAAYEEALAALASAEPSDLDAAVEVQRYRALCFFALGQTDAARAAVTKLVERHPLYVPSETDVPPRLLSVLHEVRREKLPEIARRSYAEIRGDLAARPAAAAESLERIVRMTSDPDVSGVEGMEDLRLLADGFLTLAKASAKTTAPASATTTPGTVPAPTAALPPPPAPPPIYTAADAEIVPPQIIDQTLPPWRPNPTNRSGFTFSGYLRVVIDEAGHVVSAGLLRSIHPLYDTELLRAAPNWRFEPARKDGRPVRYLKVVKVVIKDM